LLLPASSTPRPTRESHPKVRFWTYADYLSWRDSETNSESQAGVRGKLDYLEEENGGAISNETLTNIRRTMRNAWSTLVNRKLAPRSWGRLDASGRHIFHTLVENAHPLFKLADNGWKLERLATSMYSAWRKNHIDEQGNWKPRNSVSEDSEETSEAEGEFDGDSKSKKRKLKASVKSKDNDKRLKGACHHYPRTC